MDIEKTLQELRERRDEIDRAIVAMERLGAETGKKRGRPPKWLSEARENAGTEGVKI